MINPFALSSLRYTFIIWLTSVLGAATVITLLLAVFTGILFLDAAKMALAWLVISCVGLALSFAPFVLFFGFLFITMNKAPHREVPKPFLMIAGAITSLISCILLAGLIAAEEGINVYTLIIDAFLPFTVLLLTACICSTICIAPYDIRYPDEYYEQTSHLTQPTNI